MPESGEPVCIGKKVILPTHRIANGAELHPSAGSSMQPWAGLAKEDRRTHPAVHRDGDCQQDGRQHKQPDEGKGKIKNTRHLWHVLTGTGFRGG
jgi:hypothetical protein